MFGDLIDNFFFSTMSFDNPFSSLNATEFLERLRGKKLVFVGDSINRNMCESLICILRNSLMNKRRVYEIPGSLEFQKHGHRTFRFQASFPPIQLQDIVNFSGQT